MGHGHTAYGELLNVPLFLWWPGVVPAGMRVEETVESIDLMPTLLELSRLEPVEGMQGQSLTPLLARPDAPSEQGYAPSEQGWVHRGVFAEKTIGGRAQEYASSTVLDGWKLVQNSEPLNRRAEFELYDRGPDRLDLHNVVAEHPDVVERLAEELALRRTAALADRVPRTTSLRSASVRKKFGVFVR